MKNVETLVVLSLVTYHVWPEARTWDQYPEPTLSSAPPSNLAVGAKKAYRARTAARSLCQPRMNGWTYKSPMPVPELIWPAVSDESDRLAIGTVIANEYLAPARIAFRLTQMKEFKSRRTELFPL